jgi:DNA polymerase
MPPRIVFDLETQSTADLTKLGLMRHVREGRVLCGSFKVDNEPTVLVPYEEWYVGSPLRGLVKRASEPGAVVVAHNALFERTVLRECLKLELPCKWSCTYARAGYYGYPRGLDDLAKALGSPVLKDLGRKKEMLALSKSNHTPATAPVAFGSLYKYNVCDIDTTYHVDLRLPELPELAERYWMLDIEINERGMPVDTQMIRNAVQFKEAIARDAESSIRELTGGMVQTVNQRDKILFYCAMNGVVMPDLQADTVGKFLAKELPENVRRILTLRENEALSSLAKYEKMADWQVDGRLYDQFDNYGCHTGRPKSRGPQMLNLPRSKNPEYWAEIIATNPAMLQACFSQPADKLKQGLRGVIKAPPGKVLVWLDLSQIEARATAYAAGEQKLLDLFASGRDIYCEYGADMWGRTITKENLIERTSAKAAVLSFGFAGGIQAIANNAEGYNLDLNILAGIILPTASPAELAEAYRNREYYMSKFPPKPLSEPAALAADILKQRYRRDFRRIVEYWDELEQAFLMGGQANMVNVEVTKSGARILTLPSGRQLFYHDVIVGPKSYSYRARHGRTSLWKGTLMENVAQGMNADISWFYMHQANQIAPVVHQCYDEFTLEVDEDKVDEVERDLRALMRIKPGWAAGLPIAYDLNKGKRYGK